MNPMDALEFVKQLVADGRRVGIFSCEDPFNTPFHRDLLGTSDFMHLVPRAGGLVVPASLDLGLQAKGIDAWGVFGHHGQIGFDDVCAAVAALERGYANVGPDFKALLDDLSAHFSPPLGKGLRQNVIALMQQQYELLRELIPKKQRELAGAVQGEIVIFGGLVENLGEGETYRAKILINDTVDPGVSPHNEQRTNQ